MLNDCERLLQTLKQKGCKECLFLATYDVLLNIVLGSETYIMVELDMISDAKKVTLLLIFKFNIKFQLKFQCFTWLFNIVSSENQE